mgnify:FL=1
MAIYVVSIYSEGAKIWSRLWSDRSRVAAGACYLKAWLIRSDAAGRWLIPALKKEDLANFIRGEGDEQGWQLFVVNNIGGNPFCDIQWRGTMLAG